MQAIFLLSPLDHRSSDSCSLPLFLSLDLLLRPVPTLKQLLPPALRPPCETGINCLRIRPAVFWQKTACPLHTLASALNVPHAGPQPSQQWHSISHFILVEGFFRGIFKALKRKLGNKFKTGVQNAWYCGNMCYAYAIYYHYVWLIYFSCNIRR